MNSILQRRVWPMYSTQASGSSSSPSGAAAESTPASALLLLLLCRSGGRAMSGQAYPSSTSLKWRRGGHTLLISAVNSKLENSSMIIDQLVELNCCIQTKTNQQHLRAGRWRTTWALLGQRGRLRASPSLGRRQRRPRPLLRGPTRRRGRGPSAIALRARMVDRKRAASRQSLAMIPENRCEDEVSRTHGLSLPVARYQPK